MNLEIIIRPGADQPIYEQIEQQIQTLIVTGVLPARTPLPSIRALARDLRVSVITVQKAYDNLKSAGLIEPAVGRGTIVSAIDREKSQSLSLKQIRLPLRDAIRQARAAGISLDELEKELRQLYQEEPL